MKYKGYELMQAIAEEKIKEDTKFLCSTGDTYVYHNNYGLSFLNNDTLEEENTIDCNYAYSIWLNLEFELIEDKEKIDIQEIEEQTTKVNFNFHKNSYTAHEIDYNFEKITEFLNIYNNKQNELIRAVKQLDKQIHCRICRKEIAVKYGLCEKCYEAANEDVR